jgi:hypothetical protein
MIYLLLLLLLIPSVTAYNETALQTNVCPSDTGLSLFLAIMSILSVVGVFWAIASGYAVMGILLSMMLLPLGWTIIGCSVAIGVLVLGFAMISIIVSAFVVKS